MADPTHRPRSLAQSHERRSTYYRTQRDERLLSNQAGPATARRAYELLRTLLRSGELTTADLLGEAQLTTMLGTSRNAVRRALRLLAEEGMLSRQPKVGTRLARDQIELAGAEVVPRVLLGGEAARRLVIDTTSVELVPSTAVIRACLGEDVGEVGRIEQVFYVDGDPLCVRAGYTRRHAYDRLVTSRQEVDSSPPPYPEVFRYLYAAEFGWSTTAVAAVRCEEHTAEVLRVAPGSPVLLREAAVFDVEGVAQELSYTHLRSDRIALTNVAFADEHMG